MNATSVVTAIKSILRPPASICPSRYRQAHLRFFIQKLHDTVHLTLGDFPIHIYQETIEFLEQLEVNSGRPTLRVRRDNLAGYTKSFRDVLKEYMNDDVLKRSLISSYIENHTQHIDGISLLQNPRIITGWRAFRYTDISKHM